MKRAHSTGQRQPLSAEERDRLLCSHGINWERLRDGRSPLTVEAICSDVALYLLWCETQRLGPFPLSPEDLARYVESLIDRGMKLTSVRRHIYTVGALQIAQQHQHPAKHPSWVPLWKEFVYRLQRTGAQGDIQAQPLTMHDFGQLVAACGSNQRGLRNKALLYVARDSLCKSGQLAALQVEDIYGNDDITGGYLRVPAVGATRMEERFDYRPLSPATMAHIEAWCTEASIDAGYLFPAIGGRKRTVASPLNGGMGAQEVGRIIRRLAVDAGLDRAHAFTSESLRAGAVQHLMAHGATLDQIRQSAGWKTYRGIQRQAAWTPNAKPLPWGRYKDDP